MRSLVVLFFCFFVSQATLAQSLSASLDWSMGAIVSNNDFTNGSTDATPGLSLGYSFNSIGLEASYKKYALTQTLSNNLGVTDLEFEQEIVALMLRLDHGPYFFSRFGLQYVNIDSLAKNNNQRDINFDFDGPTIGFHLSSGIHYPILESLSLQAAISLETSRQDLTVLGLLTGLRYTFSL